MFVLLYAWTGHETPVAQATISKFDPHLVRQGMAKDTRAFKISRRVPLFLSVMFKLENVLQ